MQSKMLQPKATLSHQLTKYFYSVQEVFPEDMFLVHESLNDVVGHLADHNIILSAILALLLPQAKFVFGGNISISKTLIHKSII